LLAACPRIVDAITRVSGWPKGCHSGHGNALYGIDDYPRYGTTGEQTAHDPAQYHIGCCGAASDPMNDCRSTHSSTIAGSTLPTSFLRSDLASGRLYHCECCLCPTVGPPPRFVRSVYRLRENRSMARIRRKSFYKSGATESLRATPICRRKNLRIDF